MLLPLEGRRLYYDLTGPEDGPVVLMTHSLMSDSGMWSEQMPTVLQAGFRVLRLDMRGHGGSDPVAGDYTMQELADDWAAALEALALPRVHYIGLSIGGQAGQAFAIGHGAKLISVMWCACAPSSGTVGDDTSVWNRAINAVRKANSAEPLADEFMEHFLADATKKSRPGRWKQIRNTVGDDTGGDVRRLGGDHELRLRRPAPVASGPDVGGPRCRGSRRYGKSDAPARRIGAWLPLRGDPKRPPLLQCRPARCL